MEGTVADLVIMVVITLAVLLCQKIFEFFFSERQSRVELLTLRNLVDKKNDELIRSARELVEKQKEITEKQKEVTIKQEQLTEKEKELKDLAALKLELEYTNREQLAITKSLFARGVFEKFEQDLYLLALERKILPRTGDRKLKWKAFLETPVKSAERLARQVRAAGLAAEDVPEVASNLYAKLSSGVHNAFVPGVHSFDIDSNYLEDPEIALMLAICKAYPIPNSSYNVIPRTD